MKLFLLVLLSCNLNLALASSLNIVMPKELKTKYANLYIMPIENLPDGSKKFHESRLFERKGINVLYLKGDRFEMAFQHGKLLKNEIVGGSIPHAALMLDKAVRPSIGNLPILSDWIIKMVYALIPDRMVRKMQKDFSQVFSELSLDAWGLSEATGLTTDQITYGMLAPESIMVLFAKMTTGIFPAKSTPEANECSAFATWGEKSENGNLLIGRNTDFGMNGYYDKYPTAIYFNPTDGGQKYMTLASAGVHIAGIFGYNESGIYLGVHLIPTLDVDPNSLPIFVAGQEVLKHARNFDEAIQILSSKRPGSGWTYMLASTKENKVASLEFTHNHMGIRNSEGSFHVQTNHFMTKEVEPQNYHINHAIYEDTKARFDRITHLIQSRPIITSEAAVEILGDKVDPIHGVVRGVGNTVSVHTTMTSAVIDASRDKIYMANGHAPVSQNDYVELPMPGQFNPDTLAEHPVHWIKGPQYSDKYPEIAKAEKKFIEAKIALEIDLDSVAAEKLMEEVIRIDSTNPHYYITLAAFQMRNGAVDKAVSNLQIILTMYDQHLVNVAHYFLGRISASGSKREEALEHLEFAYNNSLAETELRLRQAAEKSLLHTKLFGFHVFSPEKVSFIMQEGDFLSY